MATSVYFNGKMRSLPGVYSTITSGDNTQTRTLDYGTVLLIDTGVFGANWGGGSGVNGVGKQGKDAVYKFEDLQTFRDFVKGGMYWKAAEALFTPDPYNEDAVGISKLLFARACTTTPAGVKISSTGDKNVFAVKTIDEGTIANGVKDGSYLKYGYAYTIEKGTDDEGAFVVKFWRGTYTGDYIDPVTGVTLSYDELTVAQAEPLLICQSPEVKTYSELISWANTDENFGARFILGSESKIDAENDSFSSSSLGVYFLFSGGTEDYKSTDIDDLLNAISDVDYNIVFTDQIEVNANSALQKKVIAHRNTQAKFDKFVYVGAYSTKAKFNDSLAIAKELNSQWVVAVHGGVATASDATASKDRWWTVFYNLCQVIGRVSGKPPYIPVTNKTVGGDKLQHIPTEKELEKALKFGLVVVYPNPYFQRFVILQGVTTLQDNTLLFNKKGASFSIQFMRIIAQLNKECVVNASIDLLGDENGVNINTLSKGALETWTANFLQTRVATDQQDNLIQRFQNVVAKRVDDCYQVSYEVVLNNEVTKIFFTGFLLRN